MFSIPPKHQSLDKSSNNGCCNYLYWVSVEYGDFVFLVLGVQQTCVLLLLLLLLLSASFPLAPHPIYVPLMHRSLLNVLYCISSQLDLTPHPAKSIAPLTAKRMPPRIQSKVATSEDVLQVAQNEPSLHVVAFSPPSSVRMTP